VEEKAKLAEVASRLQKPFEHLIVGQVDDYCAYLTRIEGAYLFHQHPKDEMYLVLQGALTIEYEDGATVTLAEGESIVVRAKEKHRSRSDQGALVLMFKAHDLFAE
jgi:mannose-6-phosphate isomerase-like protein (cupin superfamily)